LGGSAPAVARWDASGSEVPWVFDPGSLEGVVVADAGRSKMIVVLEALPGW